MSRVTRTDPRLSESFDLKTSADVNIDQLQDLAKALGSKISALDLDGIVVRTADFAPVPSRRTATSTRLLIEGAILLVSRNKIANVQSYSGKVIGEILGVPKRDLAGIGRELDTKRPDAVVAAIALLTADG